LFRGDMMLFQKLKDEGIITGHCGGKGTCGKCTVRFIKEAPLPASQDRILFTAAQLREGYRLSCQIKSNNNYPYELPFSDKAEPEIITSKMDSIWNRFLKEKNEINSIDKENYNINFVAAVDIGTTTIAMELINASTGEILGTFCKLNPQKKYGADVLSRMEASVNGHREELQELVFGVLEEGLKELEQKEKPDKVVIAGNTAMCHLLLGFDVSKLAVAPFSPQTLEESKIRILSYEAIVMPQISAFVGGDIVAGIYGTHMCEEEETTLFIDLGTNGEMALGNKNHMISTATAAGPAFEGGLGGEIIGTDVINLVADLLNEGIVDDTGLMKEPYFEDGILRKKILLTQRDIRNFQMAKAAVYAGIGVLLEEKEITYDQIDRVFLAGGFGYYLNIESAIRVGLLPEFLKDKTIAAGNTSLLGAFLYGCNDCKKEELAFMNHTRSINLAENALFQEEYIKAINFPVR